MLEMQRKILKKLRETDRTKMERCCEHKIAVTF